MTYPLRRLLHPLYRRLETYVHPLRYLFVEVTQRCNLDCRHCGSDCGRDARLAELSDEEWTAFFERLARGVKPPEVMLVFTGGEPLCRPGLDGLLAAGHRLGFDLGMVTNGWALDERRLERLLSAGLRSLTISLDGLQASHDWLRGREGSFARACRAISLAARSPLPLFDVVTCVGPRNLGELDAVEALLRDLGVRAWRLFTIFPRGRAEGDRELLLSDEEMRRLLGWMADRRAAHEREGAPLHLDYSCEGYLPERLDRAVRDEPYFCRAGISIGSVLADGAISACPNIPRELVQGNVRRDDFLRVWEEGFARFRDRRWMRQGDCVGCGEWDRCLGNSLHLWDERAGRTARCHCRISLGYPASRR